MTMGIERLTTLAFSMYSNKGAYALLLGAGISRSAKIPSGWEVEKSIIEELAATKGVSDIDDWHQWYKTEFGVSANYSDLLGNLVSTSTERVSLMRKFFEPSEEEKELGLKMPTKAHIAIAKLVKAGYIRVIITTNFDRLLEKALESEGIIPQVICHEDEIPKAIPLMHWQSVTILKINGDYIDCRFRNTTEELDSYPEEWKTYLHQVFENYGLISCGWSADWDKGLIDIINSSKQSRYNSFFTTMGNVGDKLRGLSNSRHGEIMPITGADDLFHNLYEQISALEKCNANRNMGHDIMIARVKKYLSSPQYDIEYADLIEVLCEEAYNAIISKAKYDFILDKESFNEYLSLHKNSVKTLMELAIIVVRWGKYKHIQALGEVLVRLCMLPARHGHAIYEKTQYVHALAALFLLNTIGVACVKYERFKELDSILKIRVPSGNFLGEYPYSLLYLIGRFHCDKNDLNDFIEQNYYFPDSLLVYNVLKSHFNKYFISEDLFENTFYIWERLKSLVYGFYEKGPNGSFWGPCGNFIMKELQYQRNPMKAHPYVAFFDNADIQKQDWSPIRQGMFGGKYENYTKIKNDANGFYNSCMRGRY
ncbi:SIR2 family protein [uncultured Bacteroides sp.]|uniref:SIR2 family protein n=2 Tax=uncultured Bacteroides sp. TaxID=162156 RepID=UPI00267092F1|nr:SIR2 family protein [uncultured Bacteroides sp.]